ncbi:MAG: hypothetical protein ACEQSA_05905 [Weeksellaceae bacterium]
MSKAERQWVGTTDAPGSIGTQDLVHDFRQERLSTLANLQFRLKIARESILGHYQEPTIRPAVSDTVEPGGWKNHSTIRRDDTLGMVIASELLSPESNQKSRYKDHPQVLHVRRSVLIAQYGVTVEENVTVPHPTLQRKTEPTIYRYFDDAIDFSNGVDDQTLIVAMDQLEAIIPVLEGLVPVSIPTPVMPQS